jgi:hypothetical protein
MLARDCTAGGALPLSREPFYRLCLADEYSHYLRGDLKPFPRPEYARLFGMAPRVGPRPEFSDLDFSTRNASQAKVLNGKDFAEAFHREKAAHAEEPPRKICGSSRPVSAQDLVSEEEDEADEGEEGGEEAAKKGPVRRLSSQKESAKVVRRLSQFRVCVDRLATLYQECRSKQVAFYHDHPDAPKAPSLFAYAQGGWYPSPEALGNFANVAPRARFELLSENAFTGRHG